MHTYIHTYRKGDVAGEVFAQGGSAPCGPGAELRPSMSLFRPHLDNIINTLFSIIELI